MGQLWSESKRLDSRIDTAYSGIASVAAISALPAPVSGKNVSVGLGFGNFESESAIAVGAKALMGRQRNVSFTKF